MKKSELQQIIKEEIRTALDEMPSSKQTIYDDLLDSYKKMGEWLTDNVNTKQSVEVKRAFADAFDKLSTVLLKNNRSNFNL